MTPEDDARLVAKIYNSALRLDPEERSGYLDHICAGKPDIRARVAALLDAHSQGLREAELRRSPGAAEGLGAHGSALGTGESGQRTRSSGLGPGGSGQRAQERDSPEDVDGRVIGPYIVRRELGRGGMGVVYLADDTRLARRVAIKALAPNVGREPANRERLRQEARAAAGLSHPGIATVYALEEIDGELYLVCEFVPGEPLRALLASGPLPIRQVVTIAVQLARALAAAHTIGVIHRDIKPENVVKTPSGAIKVLDFGLARMEGAMQTRLTETGVVMGTPAYMAPEQALGRATDFRTDLFAFGLLVYELVSGVNPFIAKTVTATLARIVEEDPPLLSEVRPDSVPELDRIVATCLRKDPTERYASTLDLVADLERLDADLAGSRPQPAWLPASGGGRPHARPPRTPVWWWEFHQLITSAVYVIMIYPAWQAQRWLGQPWGMLFLFVVLASAAAATSLRLNLRFVGRHAADELKEQERRARPWTRACDASFCVVQLVAALGLFGEHPEFAMLFVAVATAMLVAAFVIEPATARAAFKTVSTAPASPGSSRA